MFDVQTPRVPLKNLQVMEFPHCDVFFQPMSVVLGTTNLEEDGSVPGQMS